jgi:hypothetical protein
MKKLLFEAMLLALLIAFPAPTMARGDAGISIPLPPPIVFAAPPVMIVLPETYVYVVPDMDVDIFFYNGWWWRPWQGRWYRSRNYSSGWGYYRTVPSFYLMIPSGWRNDYREHRWRGQQWNYQRIPHQQVQRNWKNWETSKHWEKQNTWGVQGLKPQTRPPKQSREVLPPKSQPQPREVKPERSQQQRQEAAPHSREAYKPQQREAGPQSREAVQPQRQEAVPHSPKAYEPQQREAGPQSREEQPKHSQQQQGNHERGEGEREKQDRK